MSWHRNRHALILGHRGASALVVENTLESFHRAVADGADGIELDVRVCKTGEVIVFHDDDLERLAGTRRRIDHMTLDDVRAVTLDGGHAISTLDEVLEDIADVPINVEIKSVKLVSAWGLTRKTIDAIRRHRAEDRVLISSFDPSAVLQVRLTARDIPVGLLFHGKLARPLREAWSSHLIRPFAVHPESKLVTASSVAAWKRRGLAINAWTVDDPDELRRLDALGVDGVFTNDPAAARAALAARRAD